MTYYIVGLGNPGDEYALTRHNTGRIVVSALAKHFNASEWKENKKIKAVCASGAFGKNKIEFILPDTFMNKSGSAVLPNIKNKAQAARLMVVHDDLDLVLGTMKFSFNRGSGGHKGIESIMRAIKTKAFMRVRIGISKSTPKGKVKKPAGENAVADFILGEFKKDELVILKKIAMRVSEAAEVFIAEGKDKAMSSANK